MKLPSLIQGWLTTQDKVDQPEKLLANYVATNNIDSLNILVAYYHADLFHYVLSLSDRTLAEDIIQNTWLKVMKSAASYEHNTSLKNWLFRIARNTLIDELRRDNRWQHQVLEESLNVVCVGTPESDLINKNQKICFNDAIDKLPFYQREAFIFQQDGFSMNDICLLTDESFETVKSRVRYAKKSIKKQLELTDEFR